MFAYNQLINQVLIFVLRRHFQSIYDCDHVLSKVYLNRRFSCSNFRAPFEEMALKAIHIHKDTKATTFYLALKTLTVITCSLNSNMYSVHSLSMLGVKLCHASIVKLNILERRFRQDIILCLRLFQTSVLN